MLRPLLFALLLALAACSAPPTTAPGVLPVVRVVPGGTASVDLSAYPGATLGVPGSDSLAVTAQAGGAVVAADPTFEGLALVPFRSGGVGYAFAVEAPADGPGRLALTVVGPRPGDPSVLDLTLEQVDAAGQPTELTVDEDTGVVVLVGDRPPSDNAVDLDPVSGRLGLDLDVAGPGTHRVRLAARVGGLVSDWVTVTVRDRRLAR